MARPGHILSVDEFRILSTLAAALVDLEFDSAADGVWDYIRSGGAGWRSHGEFLNAVRTDIWRAWRSHGEERDRPAFDRASYLVEAAIPELRRIH